MRETFFQLCLYFTLGIIIFSMIFGVLVGLNVFSGADVNSGVDIDTSDKDAAFTDITGEDLQTNLLISVSAGTILGLAAGGTVSWLTHTTSAIGVGIFTGTFWGAYLNMYSILDSGSFLSDAGILIIITVVVTMLFVGAIIGMFTGSG